MSPALLKCQDEGEHDFSKEVPTIVDGEIVGTDYVCARCGESVESNHTAELAKRSLEIMVHSPGWTYNWRCREGACPECRWREGGNYEADASDALPPDGCTCEGGCRSYYERVEHPVVWQAGNDSKGLMVCVGGGEHVFSEPVDDPPPPGDMEQCWRCAGCGRLLSDVVASVEAETS